MSLSEERECQGHPSGHPLDGHAGASLTREERPVLEDVPVDLSRGLRPGDERHAELLPAQQLYVGLGHGPPHAAELRARAGLGRGRGAPHGRAGGGRGTLPPCPPGPSHHAVLGGSALLHRVFEQHVALGVTETHPAWPPQPAGTQRVSKNPLPSTPYPGTTLQAGPNLLFHQVPACTGPLGCPAPEWCQAGTEQDGGPCWERQQGRTRRELSARAWL